MNKLNLTKKRLKKEDIDHSFTLESFTGNIDNVINLLSKIKDEFGYEEIHIDFMQENTHWSVDVVLTGYRNETEKEVMVRIDKVKERLAAKTQEISTEKKELAQLKKLLKKIKDE